MIESSAYWDEVEALFAGAVGLGPPERATFLNERCGGRRQVRTDVEALLAAHDSAGTFLDGAVVGDVHKAGPLDDYSGRTIGPFLLVEKIGEGGMGVVYRAERADGHFTQRVALKLIHGAFRHPDALRRFRTERQILATLSHPHIVTLLDGGLAEDEQAYLVMEYVDGVPITTFCADRRLSLEDRLRLFQQVCAAVQHAHERGIVHRDLKPSNILITPDGMPKILDFGVAKLLDTSGSTIDATATGSFRPLTPNYASPEQWRGLAVTTASDVYGLGVLLYEVLAGVRPYETGGKPLDEILEIVIEREPAHPSAVPGDDRRLPYDPRCLRGDLDAVVLHAMHKDPAERYASAQALADDIECRLAGRPVQARPPSWTYVAAHRARRHKPIVAAAAASLLTIALIAGLVSYRASETAAAASLRSIAVLPFASWSAGAEDEELRLRLTDAVITKLGGLRSIAVRPTSSVLRYARGQTEPVSAGRALGVDAVLTGRLRRDGEHLRLTLQLVHTRDGSEIWSGRFDERVSRTFELQESVSFELVRSLTLRLSDAEKERLAKRPTQNPQAYEAYLKGRFFWNKRTRQGYETALRYFEEAIERDGNYASAYAGLADTLTLYTNAGNLPRDEGYKRAKDAALKALSLDETLADAHTALGFVLHKYDHDGAGAERQFVRAIALNPHYATAHHWRALNLRFLGRFDDAYAEMKEAVANDPLSFAINHDLAVSLTDLRRCDEAFVQARKTVQLLDERYEKLHYEGLIFAYCEDYEKAIPVLERAAALNNTLPVRNTGVLGYAYAQIGRKDDARRMLDILKRTRQSASLYYAAAIHAALGEADQAFVHLDRLYESRDERIMMLRRGHLFESIRSDPRYEHLLRRAGLSP